MEEIRTRVIDYSSVLSDLRRTHTIIQILSEIVEGGTKISEKLRVAARNNQLKMDFRIYPLEEINFSSFTVNMEDMQLFTILLNAKRREVIALEKDAEACRLALRKVL